MDEKELENLKWLWGADSSFSNRNRLSNAILDSGDMEALKWLWGADSSFSNRNRVSNAILTIKKNREDSNLRMDKRSEKYSEYDCFICHASEDKESFVRNLAKKLDNVGYNVWYDEFTLTLGDSLRRKIDHGLANSRFGVVVLSKYFFEKKWPQDELDGLVAREKLGKKVILPIWHGVTKEDVEKFSPILAGRVAVSTDKGLDYVVNEITRAMKQK